MSIPFVCLPPLLHRNRAKYTAVQKSWPHFSVLPLPITFLTSPLTHCQIPQPLRLLLRTGHCRSFPSRCFQTFLMGGKVLVHYSVSSPLLIEVAGTWVLSEVAEFQCRWCNKAVRASPCQRQYWCYLSKQWSLQIICTYHLSGVTCAHHCSKTNA